MKVKADSAYGNLSWENGSFGGSLGLTLVSAEYGLGVNLDNHIAGRVSIEIGIKAELGFRVGTRNEIRLPFVTATAGIAPAETRRTPEMRIPPLSSFMGPHLLPNILLFQNGVYETDGVRFITQAKSTEELRQLFSNIKNFSTANTYVVPQHLLK